MSLRDDAARFTLGRRSHACWRAPTRASGRNQRRHTEHGRFFRTPRGSLDDDQLDGGPLLTSTPGHFSRAVQARGAYDIPPSSAAALAEWRGEASSAALFLCDATAPARHPSERTRASHLYANYKSWCDANGHRLPMTSTAFGRALRDMGIPGQKSGGLMFYPLVLLNGLDGTGRAVPLRAVC